MVKGGGGYLEEAERLAGPYANAKTSLQKNEAAQAIGKQIAAFSRTVMIKTQVTVRDVRVESGGAVVVSYSGLDDGGFSTRQPRIIRFNASGSLKLPIARDQASRMVPGQVLSLEFEPVFYPTTSMMKGAITACR